MVREWMSCCFFGPCGCWQKARAKGLASFLPCWDTVGNGRLSDPELETLLCLIMWRWNSEG